MISTMKGTTTVTFLLSGKVTTNPVNLTEKLKYFSPSLLSGPAVGGGDQRKHSRQRREGVEQGQDPTLSLQGDGLLRGEIKRQQ